MKNEHFLGSYTYVKKGSKIKDTKILAAPLVKLNQIIL